MSKCPDPLFPTECCCVPADAVGALKTDKPSDAAVRIFVPPASLECADRDEVVFEDDESVGVIAGCAGVAGCKFDAALDVAAAIEDAESTTPLQIQ